jgi:hypothetical protein
MLNLGELVIAGLDPAIQGQRTVALDARVTRGHDSEGM